MPLIPIAIDLPPDVVELRSGDVDGDGVDELVAVERHEHGTAPDKMSLTVYNIGAQHQVESTWSVALHHQPLLIDIQSGLWAITPQGIGEITPDGVVHKVDAPTALADLGRTTPTFGDVFGDINADGKPEAVIAKGNTIRIVDIDGREWLKARVQTQGELEVRSRGGTQLISSSVSPTWQMDDLDGNGILDLLIPDGKRLTAYTLQPDGSHTKISMSLPIDVSQKRRERTRKKGETERRVVSVWLEDLDNDNRTDFAAQLWVTQGSWMGAEGELVFAKGIEGGFATPQRMPSDNAVLLVRTLDLDGDADDDIVSAEIDFGVANLTRAMLSQKIKVNLMFREMTKNGYAQAESLHDVVVPVGNDRDPPVELSFDMTGDGINDMVTSQSSTSIQVFEGTGKGYQKTPFAAVEVGFVQGEDKLWVGDLNGDGQAEIVMWRLRSTTAKIFQMQ